MLSKQNALLLVYRPTQNIEAAVVAAADAASSAVHTRFERLHS
jgi:hypothetical protein